MREFLMQYMGEEAAMGVQFLLALVAVLLLFGIFIWFLRLITGTSRRPRKAFSDNRLAVLDRTQIDENRSLLLVRRDDVEHLVMVGGPSDVVVEANINLDDDEEFESLALAQPGHEIARRVIAQRPLRTMSLASSSATVAESIGFTEPSLPEVTIAPPPPPVSSPEPIAEPIATEPTPLAVEPAPEIKPVEMVPEPSPAVAQVTPIAPVQAAEAPVLAVVPPVAAVTPEPSIEVAPVVEPRPAAPIEPQQISQAEEPQPVQQPVSVPAVIHNEIIAEAAPVPDLAAQIESALDLSLTQDTTDQAQAPAANVEMLQEPIPVRQIQSTGVQQTMDDQELSPTQDADLSAGFAAAMGLDLDSPAAPAANSNQRVDEVALEDAIADMLRGNTANDTDTYNTRKNDVYSSSESVSSDAERLVDTTRPGRVDDEMNRLLQELAAPGRA